MKLKTHKGLSKRIKRTGSKKSAKLVHFPQGDSHHLRSKKNAKIKNRINRKNALSTKKQIKNISNFIK